MAREALRWRLRGPRTTIAASFALLGAAPIPTPTPPLPPLPVPAPADGSLSVLTYNVKGLPWPAASGRGEALARIGDRFRALRAESRQPRVVLLQEAFTDGAKRIGAAGGYRYVAAGPARDEPGSVPTDPAYIADARVLKGEGVGKMLDSGLMILSDYPILAVRRTAFPQDACAGFDCLANKGIVMALIAVPGLPTPVAVINTHLNARRKAGVPIPRSFAAYRRQVAALDRFIAESVPAGIPLIVAGDLNVGQAPERLTVVHGTVARWLGSGSGMRSQGILRACVETGEACGRDVAPDAISSMHHNKDWQILARAPDSSLQPDRIDVPFGREGDGTMLSDHVGYTVHYALGRTLSAPAAASAIR